MYKQNFTELASSLLAPLNVIYESDRISEEYRNLIQRKDIVFLGDDVLRPWQDYIIIEAMTRTFFPKNKINITIDYYSVYSLLDESQVMIHKQLEILITATMMLIQFLLIENRVDLHKVKETLKIHLI